MLASIAASRRVTHVSLTTWLAALALIVGCAPQTAKLTGKVLLEGKPIPNTEIEFTPIDDATKNFRGIGLDDGTYQVDYGPGQGMPVGKYRARITYYVQMDGQPVPPGEEGAALKIAGQAKPRTYQLEFSVAPGVQTVDLDLDKAQMQ